MLDQLLIRAFRKEADVVGKRSGEQLIVLHDHADHASIDIGADPFHRHAVNQNFALGRRQKAGHQLQ